MTAPASPQPQREWILTESDWNRLKEHLVIGCTNQQKFLQTLRPHTPAPEEITWEMMECAMDRAEKKAARTATLATRQNCNERLLNVKTRVYDYSKQMSPEAYQAIMNSFDNVFYRVESLRTTVGDEQHG